MVGVRGNNVTHQPCFGVNRNYKELLRWMCQLVEPGLHNFILQDCGALARLVSQPEVLLLSRLTRELYR